MVVKTEKEIADAFERVGFECREERRIPQFPKILCRINLGNDKDKNRTRFQVHHAINPKSVRVNLTTEFTAGEGGRDRSEYKDVVFYMPRLSVVEYQNPTFVKPNTKMNINNKSKSTTLLMWKTNFPDTELEAEISNTRELTIRVLEKTKDEYGFQARMKDEDFVEQYCPRHIVR